MLRIIFPFLLLCAFGVFSAMSAIASDVRMGMEISESLFSQTNYLDRGDLELIDEIHFSRDLSYNLVNIYPMLSFSTEEGVEGHLQGDIYMERHSDDAEEDESEAEINSAYISFFNQRLRMDIGIQPVQFGKGRILADNAPAVRLRGDAGDAYIELMAARMLDSSPVFGLTLGYSPGFLEHLSLYGVWFQDEDDALANSIPLIYQVLLDPESEGDLYWIGATADLFIGRALFSMTGAYQSGRLTLFNGSGGADYDVSAFFGELSLDANLSSSWSAGVFCVVASGDDRPFQGDIQAFVSIQSYHPRAAIFFNPDFLDVADSERFTFGAGPFSGVVAPGLNLSYAPTEGLLIDVQAATFYAHEALDDGTQWYGWEVDLELQYALGQHFTVYAQAARFWHGDYYDAVLDEVNDTATRLVAGVRAEF